MTSNPSHVNAEIEGRRDVQADKFGEQHHGCRGPNHFEHRTELLERDEFFIRSAAQGLEQNDSASHDHDQRQPKRKKSTSGAVSAPANTKSQGIKNDDTAQRHQD